MDTAKSASIMIVDDQRENLIRIRGYLDEDLYDISMASSGVEALEEVARERPDLILLDTMMPGIDGVETCRRLKAQFKDIYLPVVLIAARNDAVNKRRGLEAGAEDFITKPFDPHELRARIRNLLHTKRLYEDLNEAMQRIEAEVQTVGEIQRSLIPAVHPDIPGLRFYDYYVPARSAGGDFYDYVRIDKNRLGIALGDVSGHGPPASVLMGMVKMILHLCQKHWSEPSRLLLEVDAQLSRFIPSGEFVTMLYGIIDIEQHTFRFASAGHCPPILFGPLREHPQALRTSHGYPLCLMQVNRFAEETIAFEAGDRMLLYTDGLVEVQNDMHEIWGLSHLTQTLEELADRMALDVIHGLIETASRFNYLDHLRDDCTMLLIDWV